MGLLQTLLDDVVSLPKSDTDVKRHPDRSTSFRVTTGYAMVNAFFQAVDCVAMPFLLLLLWSSGLHGIVRWPLMLLALFSAGFSLYQALYFFIKPTYTYISFKDRLLGETAIGHVLSALLGLRIHYRI